MPVDLPDHTLKMVVSKATIRETYLINGDFEEGNLLGWETEYVSPEYGTIEITDERAHSGKYSCKWVIPSPKGAKTPELRQEINLKTDDIERISVWWHGQPGTKFWIRVTTTGGGTFTFIDENTDITARWRYFEVSGSSLSGGWPLYMLIVGPADDTVNEGQTFYCDNVMLKLKTLGKDETVIAKQTDETQLKATVYQADKTRTVEQIDETKLKATVYQSDKARTVLQPDETQLKATVYQADKTRTVEQLDYTKLKATVYQADNTRVVTQDTPASLKATVYQADPAELKATVRQYVQSELNSTVYQPDETKLYATAFQPDETKLKATVYQNSIARTYQPPSTLYAGEKTVTTAGTPEALASSTTICNGVLIQAKNTNTGKIYVGNDTNQTIELEAGDVIIIPINDLALVYIDADNDGEGVNYIAS